LTSAPRSSGGHQRSQWAWHISATSGCSPTQPTGEPTDLVGWHVGRLRRFRSGPAFRARPRLHHLVQERRGRGGHLIHSGRAGADRASVPIPGQCPRRAPHLHATGRRAARRRLGGGPGPEDRHAVRDMARRGTRRSSRAIWSAPRSSRRRGAAIIASRTTGDLLRTVGSGRPKPRAEETCAASSMSIWLMCGCLKAAADPPGPRRERDGTGWNAEQYRCCCRQ
jgi:hypothetical protein